MTDPRDIPARLVEMAIKAGADAADAVRMHERSSSVGVRLGALEEVSRSEQESVGLRVFLGKRSASVAASASDPDTLAALVERGMAMAAEASEDPFAGLADPSLMTAGPFADFDLDDGSDPAPADLKSRALEAEDAARAVSGVTNSNGGSASASASDYAIANSHGFVGHSRGSGHSVSAGVIAGEGAAMRRDSAWHSCRHLADLDPASAIGRQAGERAVAKLGDVRVGAGRMAILFDPRVSTTLLGHLVAAANGAAIARGASFLQGKLGERLFAPGIMVRDDPHRARGLRSRAFDGEGLATAPTDFIDDGVLTGWFAASAAARQLGIAPTGHAVRGASGSPGAGPSNLFMEPGRRSVAAMLADCPRAILVTELIGQGVNGTTGDYSRGAAGFLYERGSLVGPVSEITIASNLLAMFASLEPADDLELRRGVDAPTLLVPEMMVAAGG